MSKTPTSYDRWWWQRLVAELDKAGYAIVKKPALLTRGRPTIGGEKK
jgi:hypothetical protein